MKSRPEQLVHMPACVAMFVRGDVAVSRHPTVIRFSQDDERRHLHETRNAWTLTAKEFLADVQYPLLHGTALDIRGQDDASGANFVADAGRKALAAGVFNSDTGQIRWDISAKDAGYYTVDSPDCKLFTGFVRGRTFAIGKVELKIGPTRHDWATISITKVPSGVLIAATGLVQNKNAKLEKLGDRRVTLRDHWGDSPILCEGIGASVRLPYPSESVKCYPLDEAGNRREAMPVGADGSGARIELSAAYRTLWYEVRIMPIHSAKPSVTTVPTALAQ